MSRALTLKYRPHTFEEVVGQSITATILKQVVLKRSFKNCYMLAGHSGCGKTTLARIFANEINQHVGAPIEIDAASNNGVDNVRSIIESAGQRSLTGEYKIFIIDECHMITKEGWNAFLKCIEECPTYTIFIFCTTEPNKVPATILNRVQRYDITPISQVDIKNRLVYICQQEGFTNYTDACDLISKVSHGGMRDAITLLDQCADLSTDLDVNLVSRVVGNISYDNMFSLTCALLNKDEAAVLQTIAAVADSGANLKNFIDQYIGFCLDLAKYCLFRSTRLTNIPEFLTARCDGYSQVPGALDYANMLVDKLLDLKNMIRFDTNFRTTIEVFLIRIMRG